jgi:hypothetical protein
MATDLENRQEDGPEPCPTALIASVFHYAKVLARCFDLRHCRHPDLLGTATKPTTAIAYIPTIIVTSISLSPSP